jgi:hypothetical protein
MHIDETNFPIQEAWRGELEPPGGVFATRGGELPQVTIGRPNWWPGEAILGQNWQAPAGGHRYGLARVSFSLKHPSPKGIKSADFTIQLLTTGSGENPVAFDLFPRELKETRKDSMKLSVSPSLKFSEVEGSLGGLETTLDMTNAAPVITAFGIGEAAVRWNFQSQAAHPLTGSRIVYAIIEVPPSAPGVRVSLRLTARAKRSLGDLVTGATPQADEALTFVLGS